MNFFTKYFSNRAEVTMPDTNTPDRCTYGTVDDEYAGDNDTQTRQGLVTLSDVMHNTVPDANAIVSRIQRYSIGSGLRPSMHTTDKNFNTTINDILDLYTTDRDRVDAQGKLDFYDLQKKVARAFLTPGESFILLVKENKKSTAFRRGFQFIDVNRIYGDYKNQKYNNTKVNIVDGVVRTLTGRHIGYIVWPSDFDTSFNTRTSTNWKDYYVSAADMMHCVDYTARPDVIRGLPKATSGLTMGADSSELRSAITAKLKTIHTFAINFKKGQGKDPFDKNNLSSKVDKKAQSASGKPSVEQGLANTFKKGTILSTDITDEIDVIESSLPSSEVRAYITELMDGIAKAYGVHPTALLNPNDLKGTAIRFVITDTEKAILELQDLVIKMFAKRAMVWFLAGEIADGRVKNPPTGWWNSIKFSRPVRLTVDYGRDSKVDMDLIDQGLLTRQDYSSSRDKDWIQEMRQVALETKTKMEIAKEFGIPIEELSKARPGATSAPTNFNNKE